MSLVYANYNQWLPKWASPSPPAPSRYWLVVLPVWQTMTLPFDPKRRKPQIIIPPQRKKKNEDDIGNETLKKYPFDYEFSATDEENFVFSSKDEESDESIVDGSVVSSDDDVEMGKE